MNDSTTVLKSDHLTNGRIYIAESVKRVGMRDDLLEVCMTPGAAYREIVEHVGWEPEGEEPEWPESFGDDFWAWNPEGERAYTISEWVYSGDVPDATDTDVYGTKGK